MCYEDGSYLGEMHLAFAELQLSALSTVYHKHLVMYLYQL